MTGQADFEQVSKAYANRPGWRAVAFTNDMPAALACGAASSAGRRQHPGGDHRLGKPSILIPYPTTNGSTRTTMPPRWSRRRRREIDDQLDGKANAAPLKDPLQALLGDEISGLGWPTPRGHRQPEAAAASRLLLAMAEQYKQKTAVTRMLKRAAELKPDRMTDRLPSANPNCCLQRTPQPGMWRNRNTSHVTRKHGHLFRVIGNF